MFRSTQVAGERAFNLVVNAKSLILIPTLCPSRDGVNNRQEIDCVQEEHTYYRLNVCVPRKSYVKT